MSSAATSSTSAAASSSSATKQVENNFSPDSATEIKKKTPFLDELSKFMKFDKEEEEEAKKKATEEAYIAETTKMFEKIENYIEMLSSSASSGGGDLETVAQGLVAIRRLLCHPERSPVRELVQYGGFKKLVQCLDAPDSAVQFNAAWSLTSISCHAQSHANLIIQLGALPRLINFLQSPVEKLREQSAWCLGNMAGDGQPIRDQILNAGAMQPLLNCLNGKNENIATLRTATWLLAQLLRFKPSPDFKLVEACLPTVRRLLEHPDAEIQETSCWAVHYITDGDEARIKAVLGSDAGIMPIVLDLLKSQRETVILPAVRTFGNFSATNPEMTQIIIDQGILNYLAPLLQPNTTRQVRKEVCWLISNVCACAGYDSQVNAVIEAGLFPPVIKNMYAPEFEVRREAVWVVANAAPTTTVDRIRFLVEGCDALDGLCNVLETQDSRICIIALEAIENILVVGDQFRSINNGKNPYADRIKSIGGKDKIARLRDHADETVFLRSVALVDRYFDDDDEDDDEKAEKKAEKENDDGNSSNNNNAETQPSPQKKSWTDVID